MTTLRNLRSDGSFYCVADSNYFLGVVSLFNSLRLLGHDEPMYVLDRGLTADQRERLSKHACIVDADDDQHAILSKSVAPLRFPADVMVLLDADMIVTRRIDDLVEQARGGKVVAFADAIDRFFPEWETILALPPLRRGTYVNAGFFAFSRSVGLQLLERARDTHRKVQLHGSRLGAGTPADPFYFPDQDAWNAVLFSCLEPDQVAAYANRLAPFPPFDGVILEDVHKVLCRYEDGERPYLLHYISRKPWLVSTPRSVYTQLLPRLLLADDLPLRLRDDEVPLRLRSGRLAGGAALVAEGAAWGASHRGRVGLRRRLAGRKKSGYSDGR